MKAAKSLWDRWCEAQDVLNGSVQLFDCDDELRVHTRMVGLARQRSILCRHPDMNALILNETSKLVNDWSAKNGMFDGMIYMMFILGPDLGIVPLYIGKAETLGRGDGNLSANLHRLEKDRSKFARWGDNYQYHIGDLSAAALGGHPAEKISPKYTRWAEVLFEDAPCQRPKLRQDVRFWAKAWKSSDVGIWAEMSPTRLTFLEYLLIGVASSAFGSVLLNAEGRNR